MVLLPGPPSTYPIPVRTCTRTHIGVDNKPLLEAISVEELKDFGFKPFHARALKRAFDNAPALPALAHPAQVPAPRSAAAAAAAAAVNGAALQGSGSSIGDNGGGGGGGGAAPMSLTTSTDDTVATAIGDLGTDQAMGGGGGGAAAGGGRRNSSNASTISTTSNAGEESDGDSDDDEDDDEDEELTELLENPTSHIDSVNHWEPTEDEKAFYRGMVKALCKVVHKYALCHYCVM